LTAVVGVASRRCILWGLEALYNRGAPTPRGERKEQVVMSIFTLEAGGLPVGLWLVLAVLLFCLVLGVGGQTLSVLAWDKALAWRLQEDDPKSSDPMERSFFAAEWGLALADAIVQPIAVLLALYGIVTILVHSGIAFSMRCHAVKRWRLGDWTRWRNVAITYLVMAETTGLLGFVGLWSNWRYFIG
jgi:hypothetical protein